MHAELDNQLLTTHDREDLVLLALCAFGFTGRHRIVPDKPTPWREWAATFGPELEAAVSLAWEESERRAAYGPSSERVFVSLSNSYRANDLKLTPREALAILGRPLRVWLENGRNDRSFILSFADSSTHDAIKRAEDEGWIVFETAGGIGELSRISEAALKAPEREAYRTMYLCDCDAQEAGASSKEAQIVHGNLLKLAKRFRRKKKQFGTVLERRAAENYAPPSAVLAWARDTYGPQAGQVIDEVKKGHTRCHKFGPPGSKRRTLMAAIAFHELKSELRAFLDMKEGRRRTSGEGDVIRTADSIWNELNDFQRAALEHGFGASFSEKFYGKRCSLPDETGEITGFLATILERL